MSEGVITEVNFDPAKVYLGMAECSKFTGMEIHTTEVPWFSVSCRCGAKSRWKRGFRGTRRALRKWRESHVCPPCGVITAVDPIAKTITIEDA